MMELETAKEQDIETKMMRMAQTKAAEEAAASAVSQKPSQTEESPNKAKAEQQSQDVQKTQDRQKAAQDRRRQERLERERQEEGYYEEKELEEEQGRERESGVIYRRPKNSATGEIRPLTGGLYQGAAFEGGQREDGSREQEGAEAVTGKQASFAKGYAAYEAVLQEYGE